ncbi:MAG TPA: DegT/DnrJ/EryC1/StrS family aminotransferase [Gaiellaceae bacterium]|nr:DegT/DnrJ/EryC1/StrS family aminotransferase [Gaiellaceae bacterium]
MTGVSAEPAVAVPFLDLGVVHRPLKEELLAEIGELIDAGTYTNGPQVAEFERWFAEYCETRHAVGLASGLDALRLALVAGGLEHRDEVIVPANTFVASFEAISQAGGHPVPVDVSEDDWNLDVGLAAEAVTPRTRFVMPVHLYGQLADMRAVAGLAARFRLAVVEDACQAHGAERDGVRAGSAGLASAFSFYPAKNLGAFGDAGALVTDDEQLADKVRALREHGQRAKYRHEFDGWTARLDTIQAIVLLRKLPLLDGWNGERRAVARAYAQRLDGLGDLGLPPVPLGSNPVWHLFVVRTARPDALAEHLRVRGIGTGRHYPEPAHLSGAYSSLGYRDGSFPVAEALAREGLSLPIFPGMSEQQIDAVTEAIEDYFAGG